MKRVINGKKYDSATAECVAQWDNGLGSNDFRSCTEKLYRKKTGEFFLLGEGGPMTEWACVVGQNTWCYGAAIKPIERSEAMEWIEAHANEKYEDVFGPVQE